MRDREKFNGFMQLVFSLVYKSINLKIISKLQILVENYFS
jgi:hypothetical protein